MESDYDARAEFHEVHMPPVWDRLRDVIGATFGDIGPDGVIVDIGAGSGLGAAMVASVTGAEIIALKPNPTMRAMLIARLDNAGVLDRVTVVSDSVPEGLDALPRDVDGIIAAHMLGHLTGGARAGLLDWVATSLAPGRSALLTVSADVDAESHGPAVEERAIGRLVYRITHQPSAPGRYEGLFEVIDDQQRVVRSLHDATSWESVTVEDIRAAIAGRTADVTEPQPGVVIVTASAAG